MKTVVVLGGAYGGSRAATVLAKGIPDDWRIILIERNTHANHLYVIPRFAVLPGHEHKAFIPYNNLFGRCPNQHLILHASVTHLTTNTVTISRSFPQFGLSNTIHFQYCVYALGSLLPAPIDLWGDNEDSAEPSVDVLGADDVSTKRPSRTGSKPEGMEWLRRSQRRIKDVNSVLVVGGGALGIQFASDIKNVYPEKRVTLLHSRDRLLPRFDPLMHSEIIQRLEDLDVEVHLSTRLDLSSLKSRKHQVRTTDGKVLQADLLLLCTGQTPNTSLLKDLAPDTIDPDTSLARVTRALQLCPSPTSDSEPSSPLSTSTSTTDSSISPSVEDLLVELGISSEPLQESTPYPHIFVIGDSADAFGAIKAGHNAYYQGEVAARNILRLIADDDKELEDYEPSAPAIKVSLGLKQAVYQSNGIIGTKQDGSDDLDASLIWSYFGAEIDEPGGMMR